MNKPSLQAMEMSAEQLFKMMDSLEGPLADQLRKVSMQSIDAIIQSIVGVEYEIKVEITPHWRKPPASEMAHMVRGKHREEVEKAGKTIMVKAIKELAQHMDMQALERYYDLLEQLKKGASHD